MSFLFSLLLLLDRSHSDLPSKEKNNVFKEKPIIVFIVLICLALALCLIYCFRGYCSCYRYSRIIHTQHEFPSLNRPSRSFPEPTAPPIPANATPLTRSQQVFLSSSNNNNNPLQRLVITPSTDEPPAYRGRIFKVT